MQKTSKLVDFSVLPDAANQQIKFLNDMHAKKDEQEIAYLMASSVAAIAFMMLETNTKVKVKQLFDSIVNEAHDMREKRKLILTKGKLHG